MEIDSIEDIEEVRRSFSAKFKLKLIWFDQRLIFKNLNEDMFLNLPTKKERRKLWMPVLIFENTAENYETPVDEKARIYVERLGNYTVSSMGEIEEIAYYKGSENRLQYIRTFHLRFKCEFKLHKFPFDTQVCKIKLRMPNKRKKFINYIPYELKYMGNKDIGNFYISDLNMVETTFNRSDTDIEVRIILMRRLGKHVLSTYLPSFCILMSAQVRFIISFHNVYKHLF